MIVVDTSAVMAVLLDEVEAEPCARILGNEGRLLISAATVAEVLVVATRRGVGQEADRLIDGLGFEIVSVTAASARRVAEAYSRWGRGHHPASLNFGDCFAYELARTHDCPLLFVGQDFTRTDVRAAR